MQDHDPSRPDLRAVLTGRVIMGLHVYGINSLKTTMLTLDKLPGTTVSYVEVSNAGRTLKILTSVAAVTINLERVGYWVVKAGTTGWQVGDGRAPTARLLLDRSEYLDFSEPSRTKRIAVRLDGC